MAAAVGDAVIPHIRSNDILYQEFYEEFLTKNKPCILNKDITSDWLSRKSWLTDDGKPNFPYLKKKFGSATAPVANCKIKHYNSQQTHTVTLAEYIDYWQKYIDSGYSESIDCLYLKDWHLIKDFPQYPAYTIPKYFSSDWLNEYCKNKTDDDYDFVYMGPKGSWTPFHADVFRSHSWSANICGKKKWFLFPPGTEKKLIDSLGNLPYDLNDVNVVVPEMIEVIQDAGEVIFVPSNWHHQVHNLEDTISINRNWFNVSNVKDVINFLVTSFKEVQKEINDCREMDDWDDQCQVLLKASQGMNFQDLNSLLNFIIGKRISENVHLLELIKLREILTNFCEQKESPPELIPSIQRHLDTLSVINW